MQGVGFRYAVYHQARRLGLNGWVQNTYDGRVEAEFEGPRAALDTMLEWCGRGPSLAQVAKVEPTWDQGAARYSGFTIRG